MYVYIYIHACVGDAMDEDEGGNEGGGTAARSMQPKPRDDVSIVASPMTILYTPSHGAVPAGKPESPDLGPAQALETSSNTSPSPSNATGNAVLPSPRSATANMMPPSPLHKTQDLQHDVHAMWSRTSSQQDHAHTPSAAWTPSMDMLQENDASMHIVDSRQQQQQQQQQPHGMDVDVHRKFQWAGHGVTQAGDGGNVFSPNDSSVSDAWGFDQNSGQIMGTGIHGQASAFDWDRESYGMAAQASYGQMAAGGQMGGQMGTMHMNMGGWQNPWQQAAAWQQQQQQQHHNHMHEQHMYAQQHMHAHAHQQAMEREQMQMQMQPGGASPALQSPKEHPSVTIVGCTVPEFFKQALRTWNQKRIVSVDISCILYK
jgi:hypothetical protein